MQQTRNDLSQSPARTGSRTTIKSLRNSSGVGTFDETSPVLTLSKSPLTEAGKRDFAS